jgi:hypothetical protein
VKSWDFSGGGDAWQTEEGATATTESGMRYLFGRRQPAGITAQLKEPAGAYLLEIVTGVRSAVTVTVQWSTANQPAFDDSRSVRRALQAGEGGPIATPIAIAADAELTGLRIFVDREESMLPIDAVRLFAAETAGYSDIKLQNALATTSQADYDVKTAIDGNTTAELGNGWAIAPEMGRNHVATFELASPLEGAKGRMLEITLHHNFVDGQHSLGRFRISVTNAAPGLNFGLPPAIASILAKATGERSDADREALLARAREDDKRYKELQMELAEQQKPLPEDPRLKQLETDLAAAQQPLPLDPNLQQLRRAVALSEEQLKNKRLTVAQDVVWALINNPAFLYNH